jgi:hypothetical protein
MKALRMESSGFTVKELVNLLSGSVVVVAAGVEALAVSTAVILGGPPSMRLSAQQYTVVLLGAATLG